MRSDFGGRIFIAAEAISGTLYYACMVNHRRDDVFAPRGSMSVRVSTLPALLVGVTDHKEETL